MVGVWHCEVGEGVGGPVGCEYGDGELDGDAVGGVYTLRELGLEWELWQTCLGAYLLQDWGCDREDRRKEQRISEESLDT